LYSGINKKLAQRIQTAFNHFANTFGNKNTTKIFERWARTFYKVNATVETTHGHNPGDFAFIVLYPTEEWKTITGVSTNYTPSSEDAKNIIAFLRDDIYTFEVQAHDYTRDI